MFIAQYLALQQYKHFESCECPFRTHTVNQQILADIKFGVSQNKVIWQLLNMASPRLCSVRSTSLVFVGDDK